MEYSYVVHSGRVEEKNGVYRFKGESIEIMDPKTKNITRTPLYSAIMFPLELKGGKISFDVELSEVNELTRCGFVFNYSFIDEVTKYYQVGIRNQIGFSSLDHFDGIKWELLTAFGDANTLEKNKKYSLELRINGNIVTFLVNGVPMFVYTKLRSSQGICGIYTYNTADSIISNLKIESEKPKAFSIMKFEKDFDDLYKDVIVPTCGKYGYKCIRADECYTSSSIIKDIISEISNASLIIADITMDNPNVFYELGYAHALNKPTILLADRNKRDRLPFDVSGYRTIFYENTIGGKKEIENTLQKYIDNILTNN